MLKTYLMITNKDLEDSIKKERGDWLLIFKLNYYSCKCTMAFGLPLNNNHLSKKDWSDEKNHGKDPTYNALMERMDQLSKTVERKMSTARGIRQR